MRKPKMNLFDYGQTLVSEKKFDGIAGVKAVLQYAAKADVPQNLLTLIDKYN